MGGDAPWERCAALKSILKSKALAWGRLILRVGSLAWSFAVIWNLTRSPVRVEETLGMMILGGGSLFLLGKGLQGWERAIRRECRRLSKEIPSVNRSLHSSWSVQLFVSSLLGGDARLLNRSDLRKRIQRFLESFVHVLKESRMDRSLWLQAVSAPLWTLELAGGHWARKQTNQNPQGIGRKVFLEFRDEEILELLLASILGISALFRLHLRVWGIPAQNFARKSISLLRRTWLPFCSMEPTEVAFPPPLPRELKEALQEDPILAKGKELCPAWLLWLGRGQGLNELIQKISSR